jgi:DEAD/DEAH box helicase domain-containing protein
MDDISSINEYIRSLISSDRLGAQVVYHHVMPAKAATWSDLERPLPDELNDIMQQVGIQRLYRHQAAGIDMVRSGQHVVVATPTASGKTLIYNLPLFEKVLADAATRALYVFPLKALAQDQLRAFETMASFCKTIKPSARIYDGDTSAWHRKRIRSAPPNVILTNPEMLHLAVLAHHPQWVAFLSGLKLVVVDEVHTYRGVMGSHMAQVFRRFLRVCRYYGSLPTFIFSSATIGNPEQLATQLTGLPVSTVTQSGAPQGKRHVVFIDPYEGPAQTAILLLKAALHRGLRTIVYTQSRKLTELIAIWAQNRSGEFADRISAYRAGFLPEERRSIEARLSSGELLAVISTSALELGIDIGDLDLCILVGYPGTVIATWQRGGRVGRSGQESALVLIAGEDALDQYFMRNPHDFFERQPEAAVVNPYNPEILMKHLTCAAAELTLRLDDPLLSEKPVEKAVLQLEASGDLLRSGDGKAFYASRKVPHRTIDLRGAGSQFRIEKTDTGENTGEIDGFRAFKETHPGAVYLHRGETYLVDQLDLGTSTVKVVRAQVNYYTRARGFKDTEIVDLYEQKEVAGTRVFTGRLKVTDQVTGYEKWSIHTKRRQNIIPLDLPPLIFETDGLWFVVPPDIQQLAESRQMHFMGGIHAIEHAAIGIFPLLVMADRNDLGGISTPFHPQTGQAAIFIYDGVSGGAGLSRQAYERAEDLLAYTHKAIASCPCESGCPSCVHSPKCGSGNRPIDKGAALFLLEQIRTATQIPPEAPRQFQPAAMRQPNPVERTATKGRYGVLDIETRHSFQEVGGWHRADLMRVSCAVLYDSEDNRFYEFLEHEVPSLIEHLRRLDVVIGFNIRRFDYLVLSRYTSLDFRNVPTLDILDEIHKHLGYRLSLDHLARTTLSVQKSADGLMALQWWKEGKIREIAAYCKKDVAITRDLFLYGKQNGYLLFQNKAGHIVRIPVKW